jgi:lysophospholipase L1-like esterase
MTCSPARASLPEPLDRIVRLLVVATAVMASACSSPAEPTPPPEGPSVSCPVALNSISADGMPLQVSFATPTPLAGAPPVTVSCAPASGSNFPVGITTVTCTARDSLSRQATCSFSVQITVQPRLKLTRFLAFGDSLTEGKLSASGLFGPLADSPTSYPAQLLGLLTERYSAQAPTVTTSAKAGERATEGELRLPGELRRYGPEAVLLMEGANDLNTADAAQNVAPAADAMREMVQDVIRSGATAFLATLPPQRPGALKAIGAPFVPSFNDRIRLIAIQEGAVLVDVWTAFGGQATTELVGGDGLHLTEAGYKKLGETFFQAIRTRLDVTPTPSSAH